MATAICFDITILVQRFFCVSLLKKYVYNCFFRQGEHIDVKRICRFKIKLTKKKFTKALLAIAIQSQSHYKAFL